MNETTSCNLKKKHRFAALQQSPITNLGRYEENDTPPIELKSHLPSTMNNTVRLQV